MIFLHFFQPQAINSKPEWKLICQFYLKKKQNLNDSNKFLIYLNFINYHPFLIWNNSLSTLNINFFLIMNWNQNFFCKNSYNYRQNLSALQSYLIFTDFKQVKVCWIRFCFKGWKHYCSDFYLQKFSKTRVILSQIRLRYYFQ